MAVASETNAEIHKNILGSGRSYTPKTTKLIISNDKMKDIIEVVKYLEDSGLLLKGVSETVQNEAKEQKGGILSMLLGTLGESLLGNILAEKGINRAREGAIAKSISKETKSKRQGRGIVRAGYGNIKGQKTTTKNKTDF